jgi:hypothetical protein
MDSGFHVVRGGPLARWSSVILGAWLFLSPWVLAVPNMSDHIAGVLVMLFALLALEYPAFRLVNVGLAAALIAGALFSRSQPPRLLWNDGLVGLALLTAASLPAFAGQRFGRPSPQ